MLINLSRRPDLVGFVSFFLQLVLKLQVYARVDQTTATTCLLLLECNSFLELLKSVVVVAAAAAVSSFPRRHVMTLSAQ